FLVPIPIESGPNLQPTLTRSGERAEGDGARDPGAESRRGAPRSDVRDGLVRGRDVANHHGPQPLPAPSPIPRTAGDEAADSDEGTDPDEAPEADVRTAARSAARTAGVLALLDAHGSRFAAFAGSETAIGNDAENVLGGLVGT